jgi:hypothetical protein
MDGLGVMIGMLGGNEGSINAFKRSVGKTIGTVHIDDNTLRFAFEDETHLNITDDGQSCCEHRYMSCDDDLDDFIGAELLYGELKSAPDQEDEYGEVHEVQFLDIKTSKGVFTISNHNEHNGYYGGFWIVCS